jgi:hypothetical protein
MSLIRGQARVVGDDTDIGVAVTGRQFSQVLIDLGIMIKLCLEPLSHQVNATRGSQD